MEKIKKCPWCNSRIHMDATFCSYCKKKVGKAGPGGMAEKPINWKAYLVCFISWAVFIFYMWWAFFR